MFESLTSEHFVLTANHAARYVITFEIMTYCFLLFSFLWLIYYSSQARQACYRQSRFAILLYSIVILTTLILMEFTIPLFMFWGIAFGVIWLCPPRHVFGYGLWALVMMPFWPTSEAMLVLFLMLGWILCRPGATSLLWMTISLMACFLLQNLWMPDIILLMFGRGGFDRFSFIYKIILYVLYFQWIFLFFWCCLKKEYATAFILILLGSFSLWLYPYIGVNAAYPVIFLSIAYVLKEKYARC